LALTAASTSSFIVLAGAENSTWPVVLRMSMLAPLPFYFWLLFKR
jgi:hypothetical protein